jgi:murein DD-endopeptidase MepM/ murein hydrolase activator NlpD
MNFTLRRSRFTEHLIQVNLLNKEVFKEWVFYPGMLFNSQKKWWGDHGKRERLHEGLDVCMYRNAKGEILRLDRRMKIPAMYDGVVVRIFDDFLGQSVIIEHSLPDSRKLCTIFAHTVPHQGVRAGIKVREGDIIAAIADTPGSRGGILPHLHISIGLASEKISYEGLDWGNICESNMLTLLDPLQVIGGDFVVLPARDRFCY